ncbi:MAG: Dna2/Cas4 domain-containing protein [Clostridiales bacterium]|nr:Dna2/Cas4 domain-containing protein [Clostridiales bacterium]
MKHDKKEYLNIMGIQAFCHCRRLWTFQYLSGGWQQDFPVEEACDFLQNTWKETALEQRGNVLISKGMKLVSHTLRVTGICDTVEFHQSSHGVKLEGREKMWMPVPVVYRQDRQKLSNADRLELCCQAMCLEEMLSCPPIQKAYLYYGKPSRRAAVALTEELRSLVYSVVEEIHELVESRRVPRGHQIKACGECPMRVLCMEKEREGLVSFDNLKIS